LTVYPKHTQVILRHALSRAARQAPREGLVRLSEKAYHPNRPRVAILELAPLSFIDEQAPMQDVRLGRTPIRQALQRLAAEGLVFLAPRRGMSPTSASPTCKISAPGAGKAHLAADRISNELLEQMQTVMAGLAEVTDDDGKSQQGLKAVIW
jgi:hypothetical protein